MAATYDRRVAPSFLAHFDASDPDNPGLASSLVAYARYAMYPVDLQFRHTIATGRDHATLYVGLTSVLDIHATRKGLLSLKVHPTHAKAGRFDPSWSAPRTAAELAADWPSVELYLDRIIPQATRTHGSQEGAVQAALTSHQTPHLAILDREVTPSFASKAAKKQFMEKCQAPILAALHGADLGFGGMPKSLGNECDALGIDETGVVLAIEVKPAGVGSVVWAPAQAAMYARLLQRWIDESANDPDHAPVAVLEGLLAQRAQLGLARGDAVLATPLRVAPVVVLQRGASPELIRRMVAVRDVLAGASLGVEPIRIYEVDLLGRLQRLDESRLPDGKPRARSFASAENARQARWKATTADLPDDARRPGKVRNRLGDLVDVDHVLPVEHAAHNLLPEVRASALALFSELDIDWHQGTAAGPSAHLRSSQVQCVNALAAMCTDPSRIVKAFGGVLDIASIRDFGEIDPAEAGRHLTFEFIGAKDHLNEGKGGNRRRGSQCTSVDAAFAYRTSGGKDGLALIEWKYTESYPGARSSSTSLATRLDRYEGLLRAPHSPIETEGVEIADLFHEPLYQLVRQQLLADCLERDPELAATEVRVVHVLSGANLAYEHSFVAPLLRGRGTTISAVWSSLLRRPDAFVKLDPAVFLDPAITSPSYATRYGDATTGQSSPLPSPKA